MAMLNGASTPGFEGKGILGAILNNYKKVEAYNSLCASNDFGMQLVLKMQREGKQPLPETASKEFSVDKMFEATENKS